MRIWSPSQLDHLVSFSAPRVEPGPWGTFSERWYKVNEWLEPFLGAPICWSTVGRWTTGLALVSWSTWGEGEKQTVLLLSYQYYEEKESQGAVLKEQRRESIAPEGQRSFQEKMRPHLGGYIWVRPRSRRYSRQQEGTEWITKNTEQMWVAPVGWSIVWEKLREAGLKLKTQKAGHQSYSETPFVPKAAPSSVFSGRAGFLRCWARKGLYGRIDLGTTSLTASPQRILYTEALRRPVLKNPAWCCLYRLTSNSQEEAIWPRKAFLFPTTLRERPRIHTE